MKDVACFLALIRHLADDEHAVTHDRSVSLLRPVSRRGRAVAFMRAEATADGEIIAAAQVTRSVVRAG